ncbi:ankyrin repeat-containing domain protein [Aspergillus minisclerotigenes]|uniref:Ankyrin repeat-containing domain protein n=1 Tax=Aspergillus minisclerotigenes TaxID=656917 RepID=A0A5N6JE93_9EURO|nr:ankyrin repeat-containing domain protein [Aspergillus minisclerotigenes]
MCSPYSNDEYTVGWISALPIEMAAAKGMLDEEHGYLQSPPQQADQNTYILGRIGKFKVVIACLPKDEFGSSSAASVAKDMLFSFPNIRVGLLVGIGGGIPSYDSNETRDIRLGDVVISSDKENGGVVVYDFGKRLGDGSFHSISVLNRPPRALRTALARLEAEHILRENKISQYVSDMLGKYPRMKMNGFRYPGHGADKLFQPGYHHVSGNSCLDCDPAQEFDRPTRVGTEPVIHYGVIATGSSVIKHTPTRDEIKRKHRAVCLEMEAAGLMNTFPCVVIRGISDYADSHKNDQWQPYAAATAAACAKEFLEYLEPKAVEGGQTAKDLLNSLLPQVAGDIAGIAAHITRLRTVADGGEKQEVLNWLTTVTYGPQQSDLLGRRQEGTGQWLLDSIPFNVWLGQRKRTLFCPGIPGAGKTFITSLVISHRERTFQNDVCVAYIFCNYGDQDVQKPTHLLASLLRQLVSQHTLLPDNIKKLYELHREKQTRPSSYELSHLLRCMAADYRRVFFVIDALDECQVSDGSCTEFLSAVFSLQEQTGANVFATSRFVPHIVSHFTSAIQIEIRPSDTDIKKFLNSQMGCLPIFRQNIDIQQYIQAKITKAANGMFLLAKLLLDSLTDKTTRRQLENALENLPRGLEKLDRAYENAVMRILNQQPGFRALGIQVLTWVVYARRPLTILELRHALAIEVGERTFDQNNLPDPNLMISVCAGLVTVEAGFTRLVHYSAREYFNREGGRWFPNAQRDITRTCATYLSYDAFKTGVCPTRKSFNARLQKHPLYEYSARNWGDHARALSQLEEEGCVWDILIDGAKVRACAQALLAPKRDPWDEDFDHTTPRRVTCVHLVACYGLVTIMKMLIHFGEKIDAKDTNGQTALSKAAEFGHIALVKLLIQEGSDINSRDYRGLTPLCHAAGNGYVEVVKVLIDQGLNPEVIDDVYSTALSVAVWQGHESIIQILLSTRVSVHCGVDFLSDSVRKGHDTMLKLLLEQDAYMDSTILREMLNNAALYGHESIVTLLLRRNNDASFEDHWRISLSVAASNNHVGVVKIFLDKGINPDSWGYMGRTALSSAAYYGCEEVLKFLLKMGADPNAPNEDGSCPLICMLKGCYAQRPEQPKILELLLANGADLDLKDGDGRTPLSWAARQGVIHTTQFLLERNADPNSRDTHGRSPLFWGVMTRHSQEIVKLLFQHGADPRSTDDNGRTVLSRAAEYGSEGVVRLLLEMNVDVNISDNDGRSPLSWAAESANEATVKLLLQAEGIDTEGRDNIGRSAHLMAADRGSQAIVNLLSQKRPGGAQRPNDVSEVFSSELNTMMHLISSGAVDLNQSGEKALSWAAKTGHDGVVKLLLENGVDAEAKLDGGKSPLLWTVEHGSTDMVEFLLDKGVGLEARDSYGRTALFVAADKGYCEIVHLLKNAGADPDHKSHNHSTPLIQASSDGYEDVVELLLEMGADPLVADENGEAAIHHAASLGCLEVVEMLIEAGANLLSANHYGETPVAMAMKWGYEDVVRVLLSHM